MPVLKYVGIGITKMIEGVSLHNPVFVNTVGHTCGLLIFGLLTVLLVKGWNRSVSRQRAAALVALCLAFLWNLGSLVGLGLPQSDGEVADWLVALNFSILSFLPAVLLTVVLNNNYRVLARTGYFLSACSVLLHFAEFRVAHLHDIALLVITIGYGAVLAALLILSARKNRPRVALADLICLLLFTASFLHFGYGHSRAAWANEVTWHHAGIPLALVVLLRDYRLLVLETFLRFLANIGLAGLFAGFLYWLTESGRLLQYAKGNPFATALLLAAFCCSLLLFASLRVLVQTRLTRSIFRRGDLNLCSRQILSIAAESHTEQELLARGASQIGGFVEAEKFAAVHRSTDTEGAVSRTKKGRAEDSEPPWAEIELPLRFSRGDALTLVLGPRRGGRRYLAEDVESLNQLSSLLVEQVERLRANELQRLAHEAELHALQAQVNPHFLFNALNTLYGTIGRESFQARRLVLNLAELFRYCLQRDRTLITLGEELEIVQAYLEIESLRLGNRLTFEVTASAEARKVMIPVLSVQPVVENAIKYGISRLSGGGRVLISAVHSGRVLWVTVRDNGPGLQQTAVTSGLGVGLQNVRKRLHLCYGNASDLTLDSSQNGCCVTLSIPSEKPTAVLSPGLIGPKSAQAAFSTVVSVASDDNASKIAKI